MRWVGGSIGVGVLAMLMVGCSARRAVQHRVADDLDSAAQLSAERACVEQRSRSIVLEWWGDAMGGLPVVSVDSVASGGASSGRGGIRMQIEDRRRTRTDVEMTNDVRMKRTRHEDDSASPNATRWYRMGWVAVAAVVILIVWCGLRCMR